MAAAAACTRALLLLPTARASAPSCPSLQVGVSPVCILGVNINRGQEISLRLRTDDLKGTCTSERDLLAARSRAGEHPAGLRNALPPPSGRAARRCCRHADGKALTLLSKAAACAGFRRYDRIRETLLHELAHMVWVSGRASHSAAAAGRDTPSLLQCGWAGRHCAQVAAAVCVALHSCCRATTTTTSSS